MDEKNRSRDLISGVRFLAGVGLYVWMIWLETTNQASIHWALYGTPSVLMIGISASQVANALDGFFSRGRNSSGK